METEKLLHISFSDIERELREVGHFLPGALKYSEPIDFEDDESLYEYVVDFDEDEDVKDHDVLCVFSGEVRDERESVDVGKNCAVEFGPDYLKEMEEEGNYDTVRAIKFIGKKFFAEYQDYFYLGIARTREVLTDCVKNEPLDKVYVSKTIQAFNRNMSVGEDRRLKLDLRWHKEDLAGSFLNWRENMLGEYKVPLQNLAVFAGSFAVSIAYSEREKDRRSGKDVMPSSVK